MIENEFFFDEKIKEAQLSLAALSNAIKSALTSYEKAGNLLREQFEKISNTYTKDSITTAISNKNLNELQSHLKTLNNELKILKHSLSYTYQERSSELSKDDDEDFFNIKEVIKRLIRAISSIHRNINFLTQIKWLKYIKNLNKLRFSLKKDIPIIRIFRKYYNQTHTYSENQFFNRINHNLFFQLLKNDFYETRRSCFKNKNHYPFGYQHTKL